MEVYIKRITGYINIAAMCAIVLCPGIVHANDNLEAAQTYILDSLAEQTESQFYRLSVGDGETASQLFVLNAYDPTIGMSTPDIASIGLIPGGDMQTAPIPVSVYSGLMGGYAVLYDFDSSDLVCDSSALLTIPSIASEGEIAADSWGQNITEFAPDESGELETPASWKPASTTSAYLTLTDSPSALPFDRYGMMLGARAARSTEACAYYNVMNITAIPAP